MEQGLTQISFIKLQQNAVERVNRHMQNAPHDKSPTRNTNVLLKDQPQSQPSSQGKCRREWREKKDKILLSFGSPRQQTQQSNVSESKNDAITKVLFNYPTGGSPKRNTQQLAQSPLLVKKIMIPQRSAENKNTWEIDSAINSYMYRFRDQGQLTDRSGSARSRVNRVSQVFNQLERSSVSSARSTDFHRKVSTIRRMMNHVFLKSNLQSGSQQGKESLQLNDGFFNKKSARNSVEPRERQMMKHFGDQASQPEKRSTTDERFLQRKEQLMNIFVKKEDNENQFKKIQNDMLICQQSVQKTRNKRQDQIYTPHNEYNDEDLEENPPISNCIELTENRMVEMGCSLQLNFQSFQKQEIKSSNDDYYQKEQSSKFKDIHQEDLLIKGFSKKLFTINSDQQTIKKISDVSEQVKDKLSNDLDIFTYDNFVIKPIEEGFQQKNLMQYDSSKFSPVVNYENYKKEPQQIAQQSYKLYTQSNKNLDGMQSCIDQNKQNISEPSLQQKKLSNDLDIFPYDNHRIKPNEYGFQQDSSKFSSVVSYENFKIETQMENKFSPVVSYETDKMDLLSQSSFERWLQVKLESNREVIETKRVSQQLPSDIKLDYLQRFTKVRLSKILNGTSLIVRRINVLKKLTLVKAFFMIKESGNKRATLQKRIQATRKIVIALKEPISARYAYTISLLNSFSPVQPKQKTEQSYNYGYTLSLDNLSKVYNSKEEIKTQFSQYNSIQSQYSGPEQFIPTSQKISSITIDDNISLQKSCVHQYVISSRREESVSSQPFKTTEINLYQHKPYNTKRTPIKEQIQSINVSTKTISSDQRSRVLSTNAMLEQKSTPNIPIKKDVKQILQDISTPTPYFHQEALNQRIQANFDIFKTSDRENHFLYKISLESPDHQNVHQSVIQDMSPNAEPKELDWVVEQQKHQLKKANNIQNSFNNFLKKRSSPRVEQFTPQKYQKAPKAQQIPAVNSSISIRKREAFLSDNLDYINQQSEYGNELSGYVRQNRHESSSSQLSNHISFQKAKIGNKFKQINKKSLSKKISVKSEFDDDFKSDLIQKENYQNDQDINFEQYSRIQRSLPTTSQKYYQYNSFQSQTHKVSNISRSKIQF